jgi:SNARE associated Golgi protein
MACCWFDRHGTKVVVIARFIEGLRQANGVLAGISMMRWRRFIAFNALGAALWVATLILFRGTKSTFCSRAGYVPGSFLRPVITVLGSVTACRSGT